MEQEPDLEPDAPRGDASPGSASAAPPGRPPGQRSRVRRWLLWALAGGVAIFALAQAVPYGRSHTNPPTTAEPRWDTPRTRELAASACFDCHSNLTTWPWYSNVAPVSWLVQRDVDGGRSQFNFSRWDQPQDVGAGDVGEAISGGSMPPWYYKLAHPRSRLSQAEKQELIAGLAATFRRSPPIGGGG